MGFSTAPATPLTGDTRVQCALDSSGGRHRPPAPARRQSRGSALPSRVRLGSGADAPASQCAAPQPPATAAYLPQTAEQPVEAPVWGQQLGEAVLCQRFKAHTSAITTALVLTDTDSSQQIVTASLDKSVALWTAEGNDRLPDAPRPACLGGVEAGLRISLPGAPVFSLALDKDAVGSGRRQVFAGTSAKTVLAWEPPQRSPVDNVSLGGHTGWVRALATHGHWLFSCSCNVVRVWDMSRAVPRKVHEVASFTGDIASACTGGGRLFTAGANGTIRSWQIDSKTGSLSSPTEVVGAHDGRITGIAYHEGFLYTSSADGFVRMWDKGLQLVTSVRNAHEGTRVNCLVVGPHGIIYTGGDDKLVRRWEAGVSRRGLLAEAAPPLYCHHSSVRALCAGPKTIVSGDKQGDVAVWRV